MNIPCRLLFLAFALPVLAADTPFTPPGIGEWDGKTLETELAGPYEDPAQQMIPFGRLSYFLSPWRAYMDTWPARKFSTIPGVNWTVRAEQDVEPVLQLLHENGFHSVRVEIGWGSYRFDNPDEMSSGAKRKLEYLIPKLRAYKLRPLILLNANSGGPVPLRARDVSVKKAASAGERELLLTGKIPEFKLARTGLTGQAYQTAFPLITEILPLPDGDTKLILSAPLRKDVPAGKTRLAELLYAPLSGDVFADGTPNPSANETIDGWKRYVARTTQTIRELLKSDDPADAGFDIEVWNEYTFGSQFLDEKNYYEPARTFKSRPAFSYQGKSIENAEILLPLTLYYTLDPRNKLPGVSVISGFANQRPWENGTEMWPGQGGFSRHYYNGANLGNQWKDGGLLNHKNEFPNRLKTPPIDAEGNGKGPSGDAAFVPELRVSYPEFMHAGYKTEFMTRDMQPFPGPWAHHHRYSHPGTGRPAELWMTEYNFYRRDFAEYLEKTTGLARGDERLAGVLHDLGAKALLRALVFQSHKGMKTINVYAIQEKDDAFGMLPEKFFRTLKENKHQLTPEVRREMGPQLTVVGRVARLLSAGRDLAEARPLALEKLVENMPRLAFRGNGTKQAPDRFHRDDFACLPFQLDDRTFAIGFYVVTRDLAHAWRPEHDVLNPLRYAIPEQQFQLNLKNICGQKAELELYDPMLDTRTSIKPSGLVSSDHLGVALMATDYPRFLLVRESAPGPLVETPELTRLKKGVQISFTANVAGTASVEYGPFPQRRGKEKTHTAKAGERITFSLPDFERNDALRLRLRANDLVAVWPRWDYDTRGVAYFAQPLRIPDTTAKRDLLPPLPAGAKLGKFNPIRWQKMGGGFRRDDARLDEIAGSMDALETYLPVTSGSDNLEIKITTWQGFSAWRLAYTLDPTAHPGLQNLTPTLMIVPTERGFLVLTARNPRQLEELLPGIQLK